MLIHAKIYQPEEITTILCPYSLKSFEEKFNGPKVDDDGITPMKNFAGTTIDITIKNRHIWVCLVYVLDARLQGKISGPPNL